MKERLVIACVLVAAAYMALTVTPVGALAPVISLRDVGMGSRTLGFRFQFGNIDE